MVWAVLLKDGELVAVTCQRSRVFELAKLRGSGICGVFDTQASAEAFINKLKEEQKHNPAAIKQCK